MHKIKKIITATIAATLVATIGVTSAFGATYFQYDDLVYSSANNEANIHQYVGTKSDVVIPEKILGDTVVGIDGNAFYENSVISTVSIPNTVKSIGEFSFFNTNLLKIEIPSSVDNIGVGAFQDCKSLSNVVFKSNIKTVPKQCFSGCTALNKVVLPDSVEYIGYNAFKNCTSLTYLYIPDTTSFIADNALAGHSKNLVIYGLSDTYANKYAKENSIEFVAMDLLYSLGDVNLDRIVDISDATYLQRVLSGAYTLSNLQKRLADVDKSGDIDISDTTKIQKILAGYKV